VRHEEKIEEMVDDWSGMLAIHAANLDD